MGYVLESYYCNIGELILFLPTVLISYIPRDLNVKPHKITNLRRTRRFSVIDLEDELKAQDFLHIMF